MSNEQKIVWIYYKKAKPPHSGDYLTYDGLNYEVKYYNKDKGWLYVFHPAKEVIEWAKIPPSNTSLKNREQLKRLREAMGVNDI